MDFHCDKACNSWACPSNLNTGWLVGLADLDTSKDYVRTRIADFFVDLLSIGFTGFRIDAAKHIHPDDLAVILGKFKTYLGGELPEDWFTWLEVLTGGEGQLLTGTGDYSFTYHLNDKLAEQGIVGDDLDKVKLWWAPYPVEPLMDTYYGPGIGTKRKVIQNDDHDQQSDGSSSRSLNDQGCVLVKPNNQGCSADKHRGYEVGLFTMPYSATDNDNDYPIRMVLSSYYFTNSVGVPDGLSSCNDCKVTCDYCQGREKAAAYVENAKAYEGTDYTRVHRDEAIIAAMRKWVHLD
ncbi:Alpha amylase, catalytic domain containing protein [Tritrichomonas foetus]|uniref:Alpha amylase, catalytic domain containing protein n=1 Tax=Tritrichomonas foetus TaxID=1144522 RepID=A0A1J4JVX0_9EUKA|nr:Alpha amylase, catalytic domain containing protein [Tritrichomonas foetus]|eukprot:OHT01678.1 Alpha amylase, catalytic domain containing protein [Tritrichomonas foetus]